MRSDLTKPYNQTDHPVDPDSADFRHVMAYLHSHGLPNPEIVAQEVGTPTGIRYTDIELVYTDPLRPPLMLQAFLVMNRPQGAVVDYMMWIGEPVKTPPLEYAPSQDAVEPEPPPLPVPPKPGNIMAGRIYYPLAGDKSGDGTRWIDERGVFVKRVRPTPFGNSVYWEKL